MRPLLSLLLMLTGLSAWADDYVPEDLVWTTASRNSSESMPCGGHDIGMNIWVEEHAGADRHSACSDVLFYIQQSGWFDENNTLLKAGRWRLHFEGNPLGGKDFRQRLCLDDGAVYISGGGTELRLWADVDEPVVFVDMKSQQAVQATLSYESWRYRDRPVTKADGQQCSYKWSVPAGCTTFADSIAALDGRLTVVHKNRRQTVFDFTVERERLTAIKDSLYNPVGGLLLRADMYVPGFRFIGQGGGTYASTDFRSWKFQNDQLQNSTIAIKLNSLEHPDITDTTDITDITGITGITDITGIAGRLGAAEAPASLASLSRERSARWWHAYWQRSWIQTDSEEARPMVRNYELMRYLLGCNARGQWPTKFNGGLFTFDPIFADSIAAYTPDYRKWGGGTMTAQNQRLVYWPMLKSGDFDLLRPQLDTYLRMLPTAMAWSRFHWGHGGACFSEQIENSGLPNPAEYGKHKEGDDWGVEKNKWLEYEWDTALEFCQMALLMRPWFPDSSADKYQPLIDETLRFFTEHYPGLVIYPGSGCETYKLARNPASTVAALRAMEHCLGNIGTDTSLIPDIPLRVIDGDTCIAPAESWERIQNVETPQLYPVFPWRIFGVGKPRLDIARNTYFKDPHAVEMRSAKGWKQDNIWAACLGLTDEARRLNMEKLSDGPYRFPAFWPPGFDWAPDHNRGGAGMIGLQEMLLQEDLGHRPILFPAWPREWNCRFRLFLSGRRCVEGEVRNGKITTFNIDGTNYLDHAE